MGASLLPFGLPYGLVTPVRVFLRRSAVLALALMVAFGWTDPEPGPVLMLGVLTVFGALFSLLACRCGAWTLFVLSPVLAYRIGLILTGTRANSWTRGAQTVQDPPFITRLSHAHLNCLENLPIFAVLVLVGAAMGKSSVTDPLAQWVFYARVAQSIVHGISVSHPAVLLRAALFTAQIVLFIIMFVGLFA